MFDPGIIRKDFPILETTVYGNKLVYLDNAATMQCPEPVLKAVIGQYHNYQANIHRGIHYLSEASTVRIEQARDKITEFIGARNSREIIFTSGTTQSINMVARSFGDAFIKAGDHVITTQMEHHSDFLPWQQMCKKRGAELDIVHVTDEGVLDMDEYAKLLDRRPVIVAVTCVSNVTGTVNPIKKITDMAHSAGAAVLLDGAQVMRHRKINVNELGCDFFCFSGHKIGAPTGTGILYGKEDWLERMEPVMTGGGMVDDLTKEGVSWAKLPLKFEAGTQNISGIIALAEDVRYLESIGIDEISAYEESLLKLAESLLTGIQGCTVIGRPPERAGVVSFYFSDVHGYDMARLLDQMGVALRSGHHCARPLLSRFGLDNVLRVSPAFYNTAGEISFMAEAVFRTASMLR